MIQKKWIANIEQYEPYRFFFPLGIILAFVGVFIWILFNSRVLGFYPREAHAQIMYFGFLGAFVTGFLMTAIPKMTQSRRALAGEVVFATVLLILQVSLDIVNQWQQATNVYLVQNLFLIYFILRRFLVNKKIPFEGFIFIPFAFFMITASFLLFRFNLISHSEFLKIAGECFILNLIFGIGSRLIPVLSRIANSTMPDQQSKMKHSTLFFVLGVIFNLTYLVEVLFHNHTAILLRALFTLFFSITYLGLLKKPTQWSSLGVGLKVALLFCIFGTIISFFYDESLALASRHLVYIGGISLLTLMIASRVMLAHGGVSLQYEFEFGRILVVIIFFILAGILRFISESNTFSVYMLAAELFFLFSILLWLNKFFSILLKKD